MTTFPPTLSRVEAERAELEAVLASPLFGRTSNPVRFLTFVCERYFAGDTHGIKEYSIAVEALGRPADFDPQSDTIVRVTAHAVRKRLEDFYRTTGADHEVQICLPAGHYVPRFIHKQNGNGSADVAPGAAAEEDVNGKRQEADAANDLLPASPRRWPLAVFAIALVVALTTIGISVYRRAHPATGTSASSQSAASAGNVAFDRGVRFLVGANRAAYTDHAGLAWQSDKFCSGGSSFSVGDRAIQGTEDGPLFLGGRNGNFQCKIPTSAGTYEVRLLFAETAGLQVNARNVVFSINGGPAINLDVVDDAAGDDVATTKVYAGVRPQSDGAIHLDFSTSQSFVNAIEILPAPSDAPLPLRIVTGHTAFRDSKANTWLPDRYSFGGRLSRYSGDVSRLPDGGLYEWQRIGHFRYIIPVVPGRTYTLKMRFHEPWFGAHNGNAGGPGSRVFDVTCNGTTLLRNFDILAEAGASAVVREFPHIQPTAQGKIEIGFIPVVNYPLVNALEVLPE
jgi:hypothetical protein